jgi:hypothetical protein
MFEKRMLQKQETPPLLTEKQQMTKFWRLASSLFSRVLFFKGLTLTNVLTGAKIV